MCCPCHKSAPQANMRWCSVGSGRSQKWDVFVRQKLRAGLMVDFASPKPLVHSVQNIYLYTQQDRHTYTSIYKETNRTAHMVHIHVLSRFTKSKQPYWFITVSWAMNHNHQPITKIGRHAHVKVTTFLKHAAKILALTLSQRKQTPAFTHCPFPVLKLSD